MAPKKRLIAIGCLLLLPQCALVTVPIETAGSIVTTTVKTTGEVIEAPFYAVGGGRPTKEQTSTPPPPPSPPTATQE